MRLLETEQITEQNETQTNPIGIFCGISMGLEYFSEFGIVDCLSFSMELVCLPNVIAKTDGSISSHLICYKIALRYFLIVQRCLPQIRNCCRSPSSITSPRMTISASTRKCLKTQAEPYPTGTPCSRTSTFSKTS